MLSSAASSLAVSSSLTSLLDVKKIDLRGDNSSTPKGLHISERSYRSNQNTLRYVLKKIRLGLDV